MPLVFTGSLAKFHRELSQIPDFLAGSEHVESFRKTSQYRAWQNSLLPLLCFWALPGRPRRSPPDDFGSR